MMSFSLATWPPPQEFPRSPYLGSFYSAITPFGVSVTTGVEPTLEWLVKNRSSVDGIHIHWPDGLWRRGTRSSVVRRLQRALEYRRFLRAAHAERLKIIWTVHNLARHEGASWLDRWCYRELAAHADLLICHSQWSAAVVTSHYRPRGRVVVVPHGSFIGLYPEPRSRETVLQEFGLSQDRPVICAVGLLRIYKGLDLAHDAVAQLKGRVQLLIGGRPMGRHVDVAELKRSLSENGLGVLIDRRLTDQEFADAVAASEAVVLPYRNITSSGVLLTAWSLGRGVIASDLPYFKEIAGVERDAARLFPAGRADALRDAIEGYLQVPATARSEAACRLAEQYAWENCVRPLEGVFADWTGKDESSRPRS